MSPFMQVAVTKETSPGGLELGLQLCERETLLSHHSLVIPMLPDGALELCDTQLSFEPIKSFSRHLVE